VARLMINFPKKMEKINPELLEKIVRIAVQEDLGNIGDITSSALLGNVKEKIHAKVIAKEKGIVCGIEVFKYVYSFVDSGVTIKTLKKDGDSVNKGETILEMDGKPASITTGERIALNFLGMMSGVASKVNRLVKILEGSPVKLLDTRKTMPGLREFEKYAVNKGGGYNHRFGLYDMVLIKENHIAAAGGITRAVKLAKEKYPDAVVEIEIAEIGQIEEVLATKADIVMLDNMDNGKVKKAFGLLKKDKYVEVSGNVDEARLAELAGIGVDFVSMGALTHTVQPLDLSLLIIK
jgi:nicotinate-nucleotide pyrophosphorylase (carboxylating)